MATEHLAIALYPERPDADADVYVETDDPAVCRVVATGRSIPGTLHFAGPDQPLPGQRRAVQVTLPARERVVLRAWEPTSEQPREFSLRKPSTQQGGQRPCRM